MDMLAMKSDRKKGALAKIVHLVSVIGMKKNSQYRSTSD